MRNNFLLSFLLVASSFFAHAQLKVNSPYSRFGYGDVSLAGYGYNTGMAGTGVSNGNMFFINTVNPAMLQRNKYTVYEIGLQNQGRALSTNTASQRSSDLNLDYLALSLPLKRANVGFGLKQLSQVNYDIQTQQTINSTDFSEVTYAGDGGLNVFNLTGAYRLIEEKSSNTTLSLGLNGGIIFGQIIKEQTSELFINNTSTGEEFIASQKDNYTGFRLTPGVVFRKELLYANKRQTVKTALGNDSTVTHRSFFFSDIAKEVASGAVVGNYIIVYPNRKGVLLDKNIKADEDIDRLSQLLKGLSNDNYGVYVLDAAKGATNKAIKKEFDALTAENAQSISETKDLLNKTSKFIRKSSGIYLNAGFSYEMESTISGTSANFLDRDLGNNLIIKDTIGTTSNISMTLPSTFRFGVSIDKMPVQSELSRLWTVGADIAYTKWSQFSDGVSTVPFEDTYRFSLGGEITPHVGGSYFKRMTYRAGVFYGGVPYQVNNTSFSDFGINFGFSFPVGVFTTTTPPKYINLGVTLGQRGTLENDLIQEKYALISLSFNFNSRWFRRYKLGL